ncbi:MAG TPA: DUF362 domain-containing protein, partial [Candidatus Ratteibacteria bacterium]|nr:DUF362 domain-containing protein [Candidatus Ratteibacteria bacterium]
MERREFLKRTFLAIAGFEISRHLKFGKLSYAQSKGSEIYVAKGGNPEENTYRAIKGVGGIEKFVKRGNKVVIKPNIAWSRTPEQAATTNPDVVLGIVKLCKKAGASEVIVIDNPCNPWQVTYKISGIAEVVEKGGGIMKPPIKFKQVNIEGTKILKNAEILEEVLDSDVFINVPIVKVHGGSKVTIGMKNLMGIVKDRGFFHRTDLHRCIAEITYYIKPSLTIMDATKILLTMGPQGPGVVKDIGIVAAGTDIVSLDAYGTKLLGQDPYN